jgi:hypothetical protein
MRAAVGRALLALHSTLDILPTLKVEGSHVGGDNWGTTIFPSILIPEGRYYRGE